MEEIEYPSIEIHPDIAHLSDEQLDELRDDYRKGEMKVKEIMAKFELAGFHPSTFYKRIPPKVDKSMACPVCNVFSVRLLQGKGLPFGEPNCPSCGQVLISKINPEQRERELMVLRKEVRILEYYGNRVEVPYLNVELSRETFDQQSFEHKVFLATIIACCVGEDLEIITGEDIEQRKICPTELLFDEMVTSLMLQKVLPSNELWRTKIRVERGLAVDLLSPHDRFGSDLHEQFDLWQKMAYHEVVECYFQKLEGIVSRKTIGQKGELTIKSLLDDLSVAQIFNLIYKSHKDVCVFIVNKNVTKDHAANTLLYNCLKMKDRFLQNGWQVYSYNRSVNLCPQSEMSSYLFDKILRIGDKGFTHSPNMEMLEQNETTADEPQGIPPSV